MNDLKDPDKLRFQGKEIRAARRTIPKKKSIYLTKTRTKNLSEGKARHGVR